MSYLRRLETKVDRVDRQTRTIHQDSRLALGASRLALAGLLLALALPARAALETMSAPEVDQAACELIRQRDHIKDLARKAGNDSALTPAQREYLLTDHTDLLRKVSDLAGLIRRRQRAFPKYDFHCRP